MYHRFRNWDTNFAQTTLFWGFDVNLVFWRHFLRNVGIRGSPVKKTFFTDLMSYNILFLRFLSKKFLISWIIAVFLKWRHFGNLTSSRQNMNLYTIKCAFIVNYLCTIILRTLDTNFAKTTLFWCFDVNLVFWRHLLT